MDVDIQIENAEVEMLNATSEASKAEGKRPMIVPVDDAHPFDLDSYISAYSGRTAIYRLFHIIQYCPSLATQAFNLAVQRIKESRDISFYQSAILAYNSQIEASKLPVQHITADSEYVDATTSRNANERNKLEVELKTYQSNMIKESIRMAHRDLGNFYRSTGEDSMALKHYTKSREFCTSSQHVLDMCISILELLIEQRNYSHIPTYVFKADAALDVAAGSGQGSQGTAPQQSHKKSGVQVSPERERVQSKLDVASGLANLGQGFYEKAGSIFLKIGLPKTLEDWAGNIIAPSDIAVYGTLCSLATLSRGAIKAQLVENETFSVYLEQEPYIRELVDAYMSSRFKTVLELLEKYSTRHALDPHLAPHLKNITSLIRDRALVLYFQPFEKIKLQRMADAFGLEADETEKLIVGLIQSGSIRGRVNSKDKILVSKETDHRAELFARALKFGVQAQATTRKTLLRMRLQQADLVIKAPRQQQQASLTHEVFLAD